jgi:hypothetical protein
MGHRRQLRGRDQHTGECAHRSVRQRRGLGDHTSRLCEVGGAAAIALGGREGRGTAERPGTSLQSRDRDVLRARRTGRDRPHEAAATRDDNRGDAAAHKGAPRARGQCQPGDPATGTRDRRAPSDAVVCPRVCAGERSVGHPPHPYIDGRERGDRRAGLPPILLRFVHSAGAREAWRNQSRDPRLDRQHTALRRGGRPDSR